MTENVVEIKNLMVNFITYEGIVKVLDGINLEIKRGEMLGLVGETGCGKTMTGRAIMRILPANVDVATGEIIFVDGRDIMKLDEEDLMKIRGSKISMIFQEPRRALHPTATVGHQIAEVFLLHMKKDVLTRVLERLEEEHTHGGGGFLHGIARKVFEAELNGGNSFFNMVAYRTPILGGRLKKTFDDALMERSIEMLKKVQIPDPERVSGQYAHELSGGMMQRVLIAMALACNPILLIADEPTTAVDVTTQAKLLDLILNIKESFRGSTLLITHNLAVVAETCDRIAVMYAGTIVEEADTLSLFKKPIHPYTQGLLAAIPIIGRQRELTSIPGAVPNYLNPPEGCRFHPRCKLAVDRCSKEKPVLHIVEEGHYVACHLV